MGCDITLFLEYKSHISSQWQPFGYGEYHLPRNYDMFAQMAGVRNKGREVLFHAKGMPYDVSEYVNEKYAKDKIHTNEIHSPSWLTKGEFALCVDAYSKSPQKDIVEYKAILAAMSAFESNDCDTRIIFWFTL